MRLALLLVFSSALGAQLIPAGQPVPKGPNPPVVFVNGYQFSCPASFGGTFGSADTVLQSAGIVSLFFDNCTVPDSPSIETLGAAFGPFLAGLTYTDGTPVTQVDVVAHSMGGLIVRSYLAGKQNTSGNMPSTFVPPPNPGIRKLIMLATPNFGSGIANQLGTNTQTDEMAIGSQFLFDLNTWNDGTDDLRGVDALAVAADGGTGAESSIPGFDDGVVTLTSASIAFAEPGRTIVIPACHADISLLITVGYCPSNSTYIADVTDSSNVTGQIIISFLAGTAAWQTLGQPITRNAVASNLGGVNIEAQDLDGLEQPILSASVRAPTGTINLSINSGEIAYSEGLAPNTSLPATIQELGVVKLTPTLNLPATTVLPVQVKPGPVISRALPAAGAVFPLAVAPGEFVAIYGSSLTTATQQAMTQPYPTQLADVQVTVDGTAVPVQYVSLTQINIIYPNVSPGLTQLAVTSTGGKHTVNLMVLAAEPSIFSLDSSGTGPAAAINGATGQVVNATNPLSAGDYVAIFLTGLGATTPRNGLDYAQIAPMVSIGSANCPVTYAGAAPTLEGVDQINCLLPAGVTTGPAVPLVVTSNGITSNSVTLAIH
jgi:uncharacterized protein (TIGR03437 family)